MEVEEHCCMKIVLAGSYRGGYRTIIDGLATEMSRRGIDANVLGVHYRGNQLDVPYDLLPSYWEYMPVQLKAIHKHDPHDIELLIGDIPILLSVLKMFDWSPDCLFPIEGSPLHQSWANGMSKCRCFTFSKFGYDECKLSGLDAKYIGIGTSNFWSPASVEIARDVLSLPEGMPVFLTVADNHDRKALWLSLKAISLLQRKFIYVIITNASGGVDLHELAVRWGVANKVR